MEQRPLRLGDILDDYCPRERRVTNHAIVAMIEEDVRQTRCTTCDTEHPYKGGKAPRRKKADGPGALYKEVLAGMPDLDAAPILTAPVAVVEVKDDGAAAPQAADGLEAAAGAHDAPEPPETDEPAPAVEEGPVHRPLIRATLPRPEGQKDARPVTDFTIRQPMARSNGRFRGADARMRPRGGSPQGNGNGNGAGGNRPQGGPRFGTRPSGPGGRGAAGGGFRSGQPRQGGGGRKRSR